MKRMKRLLPLVLALIFIIQAIPFATSAATVAEGEGVVDVYRYNELTKEEVFVASYAKTGDDTSAAVLLALNDIIADNSVNAHFIIKLNENVTYPNKYLTYTRGTGYKTLTIDGRGKYELLTNHHNGIQIGNSNATGPNYLTQNINLNLTNLKIHHAFTGSAIQFYSHGNITISNCELIVDGPDSTGNYSVINTMSGVGEKSTLTILDSTILVLGREMLHTDETSIRGSSIIRTGNYANNVDITIDGCTIKSSSVENNVIHVIGSANTNINVTNSMIGMAAPASGTSFSSIIRSDSNNNKVNISLGSSMFYQGCADDGNGGLTDGNVITDPALAIRGSVAGCSTTFTGYTSIGGYNVFPELIITEVHLDSINANSSAGPFNSTKNWTNMDWWKNYGKHPTSVSGFGSHDFFRYIEVYNASDSRIDLFDYKLIVDTNALSSDAVVNELKLEGGATIGAITNPNSAVLQPGEMAILYLYNAVDRDLGCTVENFKGYYEWRYNGASTGDIAPILDASGKNTNYLTPAARDPHLIVDLSDTMVIAVNDIGATHYDTKLGQFRTVGNVTGNSIYYGLAKNDVAASESKTEWTSWALFEHYNITSANQADQSTFNFLYGLDASADIREGRRMNEARTTFNCNPGMLQEIQKLNFPHANPEHPESPDITITEINNYTDTDSSTPGMDGDFDYFEVANISSEKINIYDYCVFQQYALTTDEFDFSSHYFDQVSYIIPSRGKDGTEYGDIQCFTARNDQVGETGKMKAYTGPDRTVRYTNPEYLQGWLEPGETAILWMYDESCYVNGSTLAKFQEFFAGSTVNTSKIFALSGFRNQRGEQGNYSIGISNTNCSIFGIGKLENFTRETDAEHPTVTGNNGGNGATIYTNTYPEIKKDKVYFADSQKYPNLYKDGFSILDCECVVFMFASMINGGNKKEAQLGTVNTSYQYASAYVNGAALKFAGFLATIFPDGYINESGEKVKNTVVTQEWMASPTVLLDVQNTLIQSFTRNSFEITYNANGGTGSEFKQFAYGGEAIALSNGATFSKAGYYLVGWSTTSGNNQSSYYTTGASIVFDKDTKLYAVWKNAPPEPTYEVTIPSEIVFTDRNTAVMTITAELSYFDDTDGIDLIVSAPEQYVHNSKVFKMTHTTDSAVVAPILFSITNESTGLQLGNNEKVTTFKNNSSKSVVIFAECQSPIFAGTYQGTLTFQVVFNENSN